MQQHEQLIHAIKNGNDGAFEQLYLTSYDRVYYYALTILKNEADTLDVTQEVFIKVHSSIHTLKEPKFFYTWLNRITHSKCMDFVGRKRNHISTDDEELTLQFTDNINPSDIITDKEERDEILNLIDELDSKYSTVLYLRYFEDRSMDEIAMITNTKEGTIKSRLHSAKKLLKNKMMSQRPHAYLRALAFMILPASIVRRLLMPKAVSAMSPSPSGGGNTSIAMSCGIGAVIVASSLTLGAPAPTNELDVQINTTGDFDLSPVAVTANYESAYNIESVEVTGPAGNFIKSEMDGTQLSFFANTNGSYTISTTFSDNTVFEKTVTVDTIDDKGPNLVSFEDNGDTIKIILEDDMSGIDMSTLKIMENGTDVTEKLLVSSSTSDFVITKPENSLSFSVSDNLGNELDGNIKRVVE